MPVQCLDSNHPSLYSLQAEGHRNGKAANIRAHIDEGQSRKLFVETAKGQRMFSYRRLRSLEKGKSFLKTNKKLAKTSKKLAKA